MRIEKFTKLFRTIYFLPFVTSIVAISMVWAWIYNTDSGLLNYFLGFFGIHPINWLNDPKYSLLSLIILAIWKGLGFNIILFLVALNNVDKQFYKAAEVDGANHWQQLLHITLPLISPTTFLVTVNATIGNFKVFDEVFALFGGQPGPAKSAMTMVFYLYRQFYVRNQYGIAAAVGVVLLLIILVFTLLQQRVSRNMVHY